MAFLESDRVQIRKFLGFSRMYTQSDPRLESAITNAQAVADGGSAPDNSTETLIKGLVTDLQSVETKLKALWDPAMVQEAVGDVKLDTMRGRALLNAEGRRLVGQIADALNMQPKRDVFSAPGLNPDGGPFFGAAKYPE